MSHPSRPTVRARWHHAGTAAALALSLMSFATAPADAQTDDSWESTHDRYDAATVEAHLEVARGQLAELHGPLARTLFDMHEALMVTPHDLKARPRAPIVPRLRFRTEPAHLVHYQAGHGGSLGRMHGSTQHPTGLTWFPHSMFAQGGRVFGQWGHALLLGAVVEHAERHAQ